MRFKFVFLCVRVRILLYNGIRLLNQLVDRRFMTWGQFYRETWKSKLVNRVYVVTIVRVIKSYIINYVQILL